MKKVLFATTALVASAGIASAEVSMSGSAEMGIVGGDGIETQFWNDIDIKFSLSGETDNGLTFGATIDLDEINRSVDNIVPTLGGSTSGGRDRNLSSVFLSGAFGTITMGDTDGALDWALQDLDIIGDIADANTTHVGFNGNGALDGTYDGQVVRYDYSFGDFAFAASVEQDDSVVVGPTVFGVGGKYSTDLGSVALGVGLGYQSDGTTDVIGLSLDATFGGGFRAVFNYTDYTNAVINGTPLSGVAIPVAVDSHIGAGLFYTMDALTVGVNYGVYSLGTFPGIADRTGLGLAANYDLGGGAVVQFGYSTSQAQCVGGCALGDTETADIFSLGVAMSF